MTYRVGITLQTTVAPGPDVRRLQRLARWVLAQEGAQPCEVGIVLTDDAHIQALNRRYLEHDYATDVLAFGTQGGTGAQADFTVLEKGRPYIGDVAVSLERAQEQAANFGHTYLQEVDLLLVHGLLHLLGYEDQSEEPKRRMQARQEQLLEAFTRRRSLVESFGAAFSGLRDLWLTQRNVRIHVCAAVLAVAVGVWLGLHWTEWALLVLTIALVIVAEGLNTALEALVDLASPEKRPLARRSKDISAAAVLLAALFSLVVAALLFLPRLWELLR